jgi:hypothetical protein
MAVGNIIYSTSSTTIASGNTINASDFEKSTNLQVDDISGNLNIAGGINTGGVSNLGSIDNLIITGGTSGYGIKTNGSGELSWGSLGPIYSSNVVGLNTSALILGLGETSVKRFVAYGLLTPLTYTGQWTFKFANGFTPMGPSFNPAIYYGRYSQISGSTGSWPTTSGLSEAIISNVSSGALQFIIDCVLLNPSNNLWQLTSQSMSLGGNFQSFATGYCQCPQEVDAFELNTNYASSVNFNYNVSYTLYK